MIEKLHNLLFANMIFVLVLNSSLSFGSGQEAHVREFKNVLSQRRYLICRNKVESIGGNIYRSYRKFLTDLDGMESVKIPTYGIHELFRKIEFMQETVYYKDSEMIGATNHIANLLMNKFLLPEDPHARNLAMLKVGFSPDDFKDIFTVDDLRNGEDRNLSRMRNYFITGLDYIVGDICTDKVVNKQMRIKRSINKRQELHAKANFHLLFVNIMTDRLKANEEIGERFVRNHQVGSNFDDRYPLKEECSGINWIIKKLFR
ncbi:hypothetical protein OAB57_03510 [Bacteriovoracaceae bacterium]|nr:hypothetical protein [Bacteriovoracaceae bacterium]